MPYTGDPQNVPADYVRFMIGDTSTTRPALSDEEVAFLLADENDHPRRAAARAAEILAARYAQEADVKQVGPLKLEFKQRADRMARLASTLWGRTLTGRVAGAYAGGISLSDKAIRAADPDRAPAIFHRLMLQYPIGPLSDSRERRLIGEISGDQ